MEIKTFEHPFTLLAIDQQNVHQEKNTHWVVNKQMESNLVQN